MTGVVAPAPGAARKISVPRPPHRPPSSSARPNSRGGAKQITERPEGGDRRSVPSAARGTWMPERIPTEYRPRRPQPGYRDGTRDVAYGRPEPTPCGVAVGCGIHKAAETAVRHVIPGAAVARTSLIIEHGRSVRRRTAHASPVDDTRPAARLRAGTGRTGTCRGTVRRAAHPRRRPREPRPRRAAAPRRRHPHPTARLRDRAARPQRFREVGTAAAAVRRPPPSDL